MAAALSQPVTAETWRRGLHDPALFAEEILGIKLHPGQVQWLSRSNQRENLLVTGNRWGKSFVAGIKLLHHAIYRPRALKYDRAGRYRAATGSITQDQANLVFDNAVRLARNSAWLNPLIESVKRSPFPVMRFNNGATIEARSTQNRGEYLLGNDYDLFIFDEVAFETDPEYVVEEVLLMRLADREGKLDLVSTPNGRNWFYQRARAIKEGSRRGYFQSGDSRENKYISRDYLDERVEYFSEARLQQNIMGQFVDSGGEILKGEYVDIAIANGDELRSSQPEDSLFISGWDLARKRTATVGITVAISNGRAQIVALERFRHIDWTVILEKIAKRQQQFPGRLIVDATGLGDVIVEQLGPYRPTPVIFTANSKAEMLTNVELFHARRMIGYNRWELPDGPGRVWSLEDELRQARWDDNNRCDGLMALALALWPMIKPGQPSISPRVAAL
ncbi:MAG: terminase family protein [candidate division Zixibacteria bacterium]